LETWITVTIELVFGYILGVAVGSILGALGFFSAVVMAGNMISSEALIKRIVGMTVFLSVFTVFGIVMMTLLDVVLQYGDTVNGLVFGIGEILGAALGIDIIARSD